MHGADSRNTFLEAMTSALLRQKTEILAAILN